MTSAPQHSRESLARFKRFAGVDEAHVYVVRGGDYWKVGMTTNIEQRLRSIDESAPFPISLILSLTFTREIAIAHEFDGALDFARHTEQWIQRPLAEWSSHREWFFVPRTSLLSFAELLWMAWDRFPAAYKKGPGFAPLTKELRELDR